MDIGKKYKIILKNGTFYTATILRKKLGRFFIIKDKFGVERGINIKEVVEFREVQ